MKEKQAAVFEHITRILHIERQVWTANMLDHADADDAVKCLAALCDVAVIDEINRYKILKAKLFNALLPLCPLLF